MVEVVMVVVVFVLVEVVIEVVLMSVLVVIAAIPLHSKVHWEELQLLLRHNGPLERFVKGIESVEKDVPASLLTSALMQVLFLLPLLLLNPSVSNFMILTFTLTVDT